MLLVIGGILALTASGCARKQPMYRAVALLRIDAIPSYILEPSPGDTDAATFAQYVKSLVTSPQVIEVVVTSPDIAMMETIASAPNSRKLVSEHVEFSQVGASEIWQLTCRWPDAKEAAIIANAVVEEFFKLHMQEEQQEAQRIIELLEDERERRRVLVQGLRSNIRELRISMPGREAAEQQEELVRTALRSSYLQLQQELESLIIEDAVAAGDASSPSDAAAKDDDTAEPAHENQDSPIQRRIRAIKFRQKQILNELTDLESELTVRATGPTLDLSFKEAELAMEEEKFAKIAARIMYLRTEMRRPARITLMRKAMPPAEPDED